MNQAHTLKCPACGAYLVYEPEKDKLVCPFCEAEFTQEQADAQQATAQAAASRPDIPTRTIALPVARNW